jgi:hypothetical protein
MTAYGLKKEWTLPPATSYSQNALCLYEKAMAFNPSNAEAVRMAESVKKKIRDII